MHWARTRSATKNHQARAWGKITTPMMPSCWKASALPWMCFVLRCRCLSDLLVQSIPCFPLGNICQCLSNLSSGLRPRSLIKARHVQQRQDPTRMVPGCSSCLAIAWGIGIGQSKLNHLGRQFKGPRLKARGLVGTRGPMVRVLEALGRGPWSLVPGPVSRHREGSWLWGPSIG